MNVIKLIKDSTSIGWVLTRFWVRKIVVYFTFKPYYTDYVKTKLQKRFRVKNIKHRDKLGKIISKIPINEYDWRMYLMVFAGVVLFCLFMYTFIFWATLFCLLLAGYAIRRIKKSIKVKIVS
jgi:hypothetical protein